MFNTLKSVFLDEWWVILKLNENKAFYISPVIV